MDWVAEGGGGGGGAALLTVTATEAVAMAPALLRASALTVWAPLATVVLSQVALKGDTVSSAPRFTPLILNCTPAALVALAVTATALPLTVAPAAGAAMDTVGAGGGGAAFWTLTATTALVTV